MGSQPKLDESHFLSFTSSEGNLFFAQQDSDNNEVEIKPIPLSEGKFVAGYVSDWIIVFIGENTDGIRGLEIYFKNENLPNQV